MFTYLYTNQIKLWNSFISLKRSLVPLLSKYSLSPTSELTTILISISIDLFYMNFI